MLLACAAITDMKRREVPNNIVIALVGLFGIASLEGWTNLGEGIPWAHIMIAVATLVAGFALYACAGLGPGDGKLAAATTLWVGPEGIIAFLSALAVGSLIAGGIAIVPTKYTRRWRTEIPYAVVIATAGAVALWSTNAQTTEISPAKEISEIIDEQTRSVEERDQSELFTKGEADK